MTPTRPSPGDPGAHPRDAAAGRPAAGISTAGNATAGNATTTGARPRGWRRLRPRRWWQWLLAVPFVFVVVSVLQVAVLRVIDPPTSAFMVARQFEAWGDGQGGFRVAYDWRDLDHIAGSLPMSMIAAEDQRFAGHHGFDLQAIDKAMDRNARGGKVRGASTISQQVAKNLFLWQGRSWLRKGLEAWYTVLIEALWPKHRIIEVYANIAELGDGIYGGQAAARSYWNKDASRLTPAESARLAAVLPSPRRYSAVRPGAYVARRATWIQRNVRQLGGDDYLRALP